MVVLSSLSGLVGVALSAPPIPQTLQPRELHALLLMTRLCIGRMFMGALANVYRKERSCAMLMMRREQESGIPSSGVVIKRQPEVQTTMRRARNG